MAASDPPFETDARRGVLFLVVGASGVGKDTLIDALRRERPDLAFPRRLITRAADAAGEDHDAIDEAAFDRLEAAGAFALSWRAHGLAYGVPIVTARELAQGRSVVANVSRAVIPQARDRFAPVRVLNVTAPRAVRAARLAARGRETAEEIERRLARAVPVPTTGADVVTIDNGGALAAGVAAIVDAIDAAEAAPRPPINPSGETDGGA